MTLDDLIDGRDEFLTPDELAKMLKRGRRWVYDAARAGQLPKPHRIGGQLRFRKSEIRSWLAEQEVR